MGKAQDWLYALDAGVGTAAQALNLGGYVATNGLNPPFVVVTEGYQLANNATQLYQGLRGNGGVKGIADNPMLYQNGVVFANTVNGVTSAYDLTTAPGRLRVIRETNQRDGSRLRRGLRYVAFGAGVVSDALNVVEAGVRVARRFGADF
ncbi:hypothetical protein A3K63_01075 [Candidatus Micrarchaeota archaeon RBG_16_49_10]|nr:MAG: hypothetical protein A3K63_01075 [Candidatus Micrarchaeota archaeon RBG_16_49_10]